MGKIETFDGITFWKKAYAHQRGKLLKRVQVPDDQIKILVNKHTWNYLLHFATKLRQVELKKVNLVSSNQLTY